MIVTKFWYLYRFSNGGSQVSEWLIHQRYMWLWRASDLLKILRLQQDPCFLFNRYRHTQCYIWGFKYPKITCMVSIGFKLFDMIICRCCKCFPFNRYWNTQYFVSMRLYCCFKYPKITCVVSIGSSFKLLTWLSVGITDHVQPNLCFPINRFWNTQ